jgi:hypothetical protein
VENGLVDEVEATERVSEQVKGHVVRAELEHDVDGQELAVLHRALGAVRKFRCTKAAAYA